MPLKNFVIINDFNHLAFRFFIHKYFFIKKTLCHNIKEIEVHIFFQSYTIEFISINNI